VENISSRTNLKTLRAGVVLFVFAVALFFRLDDVVGARVLQDSVGPYWAAMRLDGRAHASPYGAGLLIPYLGLLQVAGSLWQATNLLAVFHALAGPVAAWVGFRLSPSQWLPGCIIGLLVAADPGLIDTFLSGAEGYLAPVYVGLLLATTGWLPWIFFALAMANHPLSIVALPLIVRRENLAPHAWIGIVFCAFLVGVQAVGWGEPGVSGGDSGVTDAIGAYVHQGGAIAVAALVGPFVALFRGGAPRQGLRVIVCFGLLLCVGGWLGYLRDHHLRLLTIPALACWLVLPSRRMWLLVVLVVAPNGPNMPPESGVRASTLGLVSHLGRSIQPMDGPMVVDRVWVSGGPAVEPSALMLDLYLRNWGPIAPGSDMVVVLAADAHDLDAHSVPGAVIAEGRGFTVARAGVDAVRDWSRQFCGMDIRIGGAWDALSVLQPDITTEEAELWWECP